MAKDYKKGDDYKLYLNTASYASPTWVLIKAVTGIAVDRAPSDIVIPEQGISDGHLHGHGDPAITFTLFEDGGDSNVVALITAINADTMKELAVANGPIATAGTKFYRLEAILTAPHSAERGEAASYDVEAKRHANSDYDLSVNTAA